MISLVILLYTICRGVEFSSIGHRVVHGGEKFQGPVVITEKVKDEIRQLADLAPLHNPTNLLGIELMQKLYPSKIQTAVFDTSFHQTLPEKGTVYLAATNYFPLNFFLSISYLQMWFKAYRYAIPEKYYTSYGVRRYGFHGTSHQYVIKKAATILGRPLDELNMVYKYKKTGNIL